jgi:hypothetical protein
MLIYFDFLLLGLEPVLRKSLPKRNAEPTSTEAQTKVNKSRYEITDPIGVLKAARCTVRHHKKGWLKEDLLASGYFDGSKSALHAKVCADYNAQKLYIRAQQDILGFGGGFQLVTYNARAEHRGEVCEQQDGGCSQESFELSVSFAPL